MPSYDYRDADITATNTITAINAQADVSAPGGLTAPPNSNLLIALDVSMALLMKAATWATIIVRLSGNAITGAQPVINLGAVASDFTTSGEAVWTMPTYRQILNIPLVGNGTIVANAVAAAGAFGTGAKIHLGLGFVFGP